MTAPELAIPSRGGASTGAWRIGGSLFAAVVLVWFTFHAVSLIAHEELTVITEFDAADITVVDVRAVEGSITILAADTDQVTVTARVSQGLVSHEPTSVQEDGRLQLRASCPPRPVGIWCRVDYNIEVPAATDIVAHTSRDTISVTGVTGTTTLRTFTGDVVLNRVGGTVDASSNHGSVRGTNLEASRVDADASDPAGSVLLEFTRAPTQVEARAAIGNATVRVPNDEATYAVDISGSPTSTLIRTDPASNRTISVKTGGGAATVEYVSRG